MSKFLLEVLSEEMPSGLQGYAQRSFLAFFLSAVRDLKVGEVEVFVSCRRIIVTVDGIDTSFVVERVDKKGPAVESDPLIVERFATSNATTVSQLCTKAVGNREYYFASAREKPLCIEEIMKQRTEEILKNFTWPTSMRWGSYAINWVRPIKSIVCMLGEKVLPVCFHHYTAGAVTKGSFHDPSAGELVVTSAEDYMSLLLRHGVIASQSDRKNIIKKKISELEKENNFSVHLSEELLAEVVGLTESPNVFIGSFPASFLDLPDRLIMTVIVSHQKVFPIFKDGALLNKFIVVSSLSSEAPIRGYERVITARLADAASMVSIDFKTPLGELKPKLKQLVFHKKLGNFAEKVERVRALAKFVAFWVTNASIIKVGEAAELAKLDLLTTFVRDFHELAGFIGAYYLSLEGGRDPEIIDAVRDHYLPVDADSPCPGAPVTVTLALADKMDTLVGLISANEKVTSTRDPLGIRRAAVCILRIIIENNLNVPLKVFLMKAIDLYPPSLFFSLMSRLGINSDEEKKRKGDIMNFILDFFNERLRVMLLKKGVSQAIFSSVSSTIEYPLMLAKKCISVTEWLAQAEGIKFMRLYKRIVGIQKNFADAAKAKFSKKVLVLPEEVELIQSFEDFQPLFSGAMKSGDFKTALALCNDLAGPISVFMDRVVVDVESPELKKNRVGLLLSVAEVLDELCRFDLLTKHLL